MKYNYFAVTIEYPKEQVYKKTIQDHYYFAYVEKLPEHSNIKNLFEDKRIMSANLFAGGKKAAEQIVDGWNEAYKKNGTYAF